MQDPAFLPSLAKWGQTLAGLWRVVREDGTVLTFTDHDSDLVRGGETYEAKASFVASAVDAKADMSVDNLEVRAVFTSDGIVDAEALAGLYDNAEVTLRLVDWTDPDGASMVLLRGRIGEVSAEGLTFRAELLSWSALLQRPVCDLAGPTCRANLGDADCQVVLAGYTVTGALTDFVDRLTVVDSAIAEAAGYYSWGKITFTSGNNAGITLDVREHAAGGTLTLTTELPYAPAIGDAYSLHAGCDKTWDTCRTKFANGVNFQGEPFMPGNDSAFEYPNAR